MMEFLNDNPIKKMLLFNVFVCSFLIFLWGCGSLKVPQIALPEGMQTDTILLKGSYKFNLKGGKIIFGNYSSDKLRSGSFQFGLPVPFTGLKFKKRKNMFSFLLHTSYQKDLKVSGFAKFSTIDNEGEGGIFSAGFGKVFKGKKFDDLNLSEQSYTMYIRTDGSDKYWLSVFDMTNDIDIVGKGGTYKGLIEGPNGERIVMQQIRTTKNKQLFNTDLLSSVVYGYNFYKDGKPVATADLNKRGWIALKKYLSQGEKDAIVAVISAMMLRGTERTGGGGYNPNMDN